MSEFYFVCSNKNCQPGRWGGDIIEIPEEHEEHINCPNCKQKYFIAEDKSVLAKFDEKPVVIESFSGLASFLENYTLKRLFIKTLHLKGISDNENFNKVLSFDTCFIENLIIEDLDLKTTCTPIVFNGCYIEKITISNCRITEDEKKDFWGPNSFYGIVFNETEIFQLLKIDNFDGELMFKTCDFSVPIIVSNSKVHKINLVNSKSEPQFEIQNSTIKEKLFLPPLEENGGIAGPPPAKKVIENVVKDSGNGAVKLKNKFISDLSFEVKEEFCSSVKITNCIIENLSIRDQVFSQNIEFYNCLFLNPILVSKATFKKMLCFEACNFSDDFSLDEIAIGTDFHLSYSTFAKNLNVNHTSISGYFNMHSALVSGAFNLERCTVNQNLTLVGSGFEKVFFNTANFNHEVFINTCRVNGLFKANFLTAAGDFEFNKCTLNKDIEISNAKINGDIRITDSYLSENLNLTLAEVMGDIVFTQSTFIGKVDFLLSKISSLWLYSNLFASNFMKNQGSIEKTTQIINNVFYQQLILYQITLTDSKLNNNFFLEKLDLDDIDCDDIVMDANWIESMNMENVVCGKFFAESSIFNSIDISEIVCNKKFIFNSSSFYGESNLNQSKFIRLVEFTDCVFEDSLTIENNNLGSSLRFKNDDFKAKSDKCADLTITENEISSSLQFEQMSLDGKTFIQKNNVGQELSVIYSKINPGEASEQEFSLRSIEKGLWIDQNNVVHNVQLKYLVCEAPVYFERNLVTGSLKIGGSKYETWFNKSVSFSKNRVRAIETDDCQFVENACFFNNHIEGGFVFGNSNFNMNCDASGSYAGGSALFANTYFKSELILDNAFFDKRLDFNNCYPDKVSIKGSTLHGFNMPSNWRMKNGRLCSVEGNQYHILIDEKMLFGKDKNVTFTYNLTCAFLLDDPLKMKTLKQNWRSIKLNYQQQDEDADELPDELKVLFYYEPLIDQLLKDEFFPLYYKFIETFEIDEITNMTRSLVDKLEKETVSSEVIDSLKEFCMLFDQLLSAFNSLNGGDSSQISEKQIKPLLYERLQDQYLVVKEIYGGNGELGDEDRAYFRWMHYKNLFDFQLSKWYQKPAKMFKWLIFENIFGWGVNLFRIFGSTILLVLIFTGIYWIGGQLNPALSINWDGVDVPIAMLDLGNLVLLTLQTTFAAFMGDWSPAGLGSMKVWMTINAVLGVLLVAFLIGAYGRKMLR